MEFALSEQQILMQDSVDRFLQDHAGLDAVRETVANGAVHDAQVWQGLVDLGISGLLVPEEYGGTGLALLDAMLVQEMLGRHVVPVAFLATSVLTPLALLAAGSEAQKQKWLPAIADGSLQVAMGLSEASGSRDEAGIVAADDILNGRALFVLGAAGAELILLITGEGDVYASRLNSAPTSSESSPTWSPRSGFPAGSGSEVFPISWWAIATGCSLSTRMRICSGESVIG